MINIDKSFFYEMENNLEKRAHKLGLLIRLMRETAGMSQEEIANALGTSASSISKIENNHQTVSVALFRGIIRETKCGELALVYIFGVEGIRILDSIKEKLQLK